MTKMIEAGMNIARLNFAFGDHKVIFSYHSSNRKLSVTVARYSYSNFA